MLRKEMGMTVFLTTHYMEEAARAGHIGIMQKGHLTTYGTPFELKERFAKDKLTLIPTEGKRAEVTAFLERQGITYKEKEQTIKITMDSTLSAMPILEQTKELISGFEVTQGTMDDVFLNATGE